MHPYRRIGTATRTAALIAAGVFGAIAGCSKSMSTGNEFPQNVGVLLTDSPFPFDQMARADLFVVSVSAGADSGAGGGPCTNATVIARPDRAIDLLTLQGGVSEQLGVTTLPAGRYGAVCITIDTDRSSLTRKDGTVLTSTSSPGINWSASGQRLIKADLFQPIEVGASYTNILIHFDVGRSLIPAADVTPVGPAGWFYYVPSIDAMDPATVGWITGTVVDAPAGSAPLRGASVRAMVGDPSWAPDTWFVAATGSTDALGHFTLAYLTPSAHWAPHGWVYTVEVYPPTPLTRAVQRRSGVDVTAGGTTALGTISLN